MTELHDHPTMRVVGRRLRNSRLSANATRLEDLLATLYLSPTALGNPLLFVCAAYIHPRGCATQDAVDPDLPRVAGRNDR